MNYKLQKLATDIRTYLFLGGLIIAVTAGAMSWANLPGKVKEVEKKTEENQDNIQALAGTIQQYIAVQAAKEEETEKREKLLLKLIEKMTDGQ